MKSLKLKIEKENFKMVQKTVNLVMAVANDNGNGYAKTYCQFEDGSNNTTITPSLYAPAIGESIPDLSDVNLKNLNSNMDVIIKSPALKKSSEYLVGEAAATSSNLTDYNVEANTGKATPDMSIIIPATKIAYAALEHVITQNNGIPNTINVTLPYYITCLPIAEFSNHNRRELLSKKLSKGKHTVLIKNLNHDVKVIITFSKENTYVYPEGVTAQIGLIRNPDNFLAYRQDALFTNAPFKNGKEYNDAGNILLIDLGDGTTDLSIMHGLHPLKGLGVNTSINQGVGTAAAAASDQLAIEYPQLGHYSRSTFLNYILQNNQKGKILRKYLNSQIEQLIRIISTAVAKEYRQVNNNINSIVVLGGGVNLLTKDNQATLQAFVDELDPFVKHVPIWWIPSKYSQLLNLDGLRTLLSQKLNRR